MNLTVPPPSQNSHAVRWHWFQWQLTFNNVAGALYTVSSVHWEPSLSQWNAVWKKNVLSDVFMLFTLCGRVCWRQHAAVWSCLLTATLCVAVFVDGNTLCGHVCWRQHAVWPCFLTATHCCVAMFVDRNTLCGRVCWWQHAVWSCLLAATLCVAYCTALVARHSLSLATIKPSPRQSSTTITDSMSASELKCAVFCHVYPDTAVFSSRPRSEGWPHYGHTFSIYLCPLSFWLTLPRRVLSTYNTHTPV